LIRAFFSLMLLVSGEKVLTTERVGWVDRWSWNRAS